MVYSQHFHSKTDKKNLPLHWMNDAHCMRTAQMMIICSVHKAACDEDSTIVQIPVLSY